MCMNQVEVLLEKIRINCVRLADRHTRNHLYYKGCSVYFEVPTIILSVFSGSFSVGSDPFIDQESISVITCSISMVITILTSIKLYMKITESSTEEKDLAVQYKVLALDVFKHLTLGKSETEFLNKCYSTYLNLIENSNILNPISKKDELLIIYTNPKNDGTSVNSELTDPSPNIIIDSNNI